MSLFTLHEDLIINLLSYLRVEDINSFLITSKETKAQYGKLCHTLIVSSFKIGKHLLKLKYTPPSEVENLYFDVMQNRIMLALLPDTPTETEESIALSILRLLYPEIPPETAFLSDAEFNGGDPTKRDNFGVLVKCVYRTDNTYNYYKHVHSFGLCLTKIAMTICIVKRSKPDIYTVAVKTGHERTQKQVIGLKNVHIFNYQHN